MSAKKLTLDEQVKIIQEVLNNPKYFDESQRELVKKEDNSKNE